MHNLRGQTVPQENCFFLGFVGFGVEHRKIVAAQVVEHPRLLEVITFRKDTHVSVGFEDFAHENRVVPRLKLVNNFTFEMCDAFTDGWRLNPFRRHRREVGFLEFVKASARQRTAGVDSLQQLEGGNVHDKLARLTYEQMGVVGRDEADG